MIRSRWLVWAGLAVTALTGCNHQAPDVSPRALSQASPETELAKPADSADVHTWGGYLAAQAKIHAKDVDMHPYIYVIPGGDSVAATTRRKEEIDSIHHSIGPILIPGSLLILGGPDGQQTGAFITDLSKQLKTNALKGIVVLVVSDNSQKAVVSHALQPTGAMARFVAM